MNEVAIPVGGIGDWFKGKIKAVIMEYVRPYWTDFKNAVAERDFGKLADLIENIAKLAGYAEIGKAIADVFRAIQAGDYATAIEKALALWRLIAPLFQRESQPIRLGSIAGTDAQFEAEVDAVLDTFFPAPAVAATGEELGPDGKPVGFGLIEIAAIFSIGWTVWQMIQARNKRLKPPVVG